MVEPTFRAFNRGGRARRKGSSPTKGVAGSRFSVGLQDGAISGARANGSRARNRGKNSSSPRSQLPSARRAAY
jgi:hypothetical protein